MLGRVLRWARSLLGVAFLVGAIWYLVVTVDSGQVLLALRGVADDPVPLLVAVLLYVTAFLLRTLAWTWLLPGLSLGQSWAGLHVSLLGNHVLPFRLGEVLRVTSVLARTELARADVIASVVLLRALDLVLVLGFVLFFVGFAVAALGGFVTGWLFVLLTGLVLVLAGAVVWIRRLRRAGRRIRTPGPVVVVLSGVAWLLEAQVMQAAAGAAGFHLSYPMAVAVTAVTIAAQALAVTPGGIGTYEAAATAALVALTAEPGEALAAALLAHAVKTLYALVAGGVALVRPAPPYLGRWRLPRDRRLRPPRAPVRAEAPVVVLLPAYDEAERIGAVLDRVPAAVAGRPVRTLVVDDGSTDGSGGVAAAAGAWVVSHAVNRGLGAAVRTGLAAAGETGPACVVYLDADGEYPPEQVGDLAAPVLAGTADYVVGSRFAGTIERMHPHRRFGNRVLTRWVRWMTRLPVLTDGQSGMRAFSPEAAAAAVIRHDYNYAQVLTLSLVGQGFAYAEVPIRYAFRTSGTSFVRLGRYLARVLPAVRAELQAGGRRPAAAAPVGDGRTGEGDGAAGHGGPTSPGAGGGGARARLPAG